MSRQRRVRPEDLDEVEQAAYYLARLFSSVEPRILPALAYPVFLDLVHDGLAEDNLDEYVARLLAARSPASLN